MTSTMSLVGAVVLFCVIMLSSKNSRVHVLDKVFVDDVARTLIEGGIQKEPFHLFDMDEAYRRIVYFQKSMPRVKLFYALKANSHDKLLKMAVAMGVGFDCASPGEIYKLLRLNVNPLSIIFAVPAKPPEWMTYARESGVRHTTFDSSCELMKINKYWSDAKLLLRISVEADCIYKLGEKFGCDYDTEAVELLEQAAALNLEVVGVAFHVGSVCNSAKSYAVGLQKVKALFDHEQREGRRMYVIDIGGGFLCDSMDQIDQVSQIVNETLESLFPDPSVQVIAEPGRYICEAAFTRYCNIINVRKVTIDKEQVNMLYIGDGVHGSLRFDDPWHTVRILEQKNNQNKEKTLKKVIIWGPSGNNQDCVMTKVDIRLPECSVDDWLVFPIRGGYSTACASLSYPELIYNVMSKEYWNNVKHHSVFNSEDFIEDPNFTAFQLSTSPPILQKSHHTNTNVILK